MDIKNIFSLGQDQGQSDSDGFLKNLIFIQENVWFLQNYTVHGTGRF